MHILHLFIVVFYVLNLCSSITVKEKVDTDRVLINRPKANVRNEATQNPFLKSGHIRRRRYLGLSRKFKLNKRYQDCVGPGDVQGHCKHLEFCPMNVMATSRNTLEYLCIIERRFVGVCCPDDIALSGMIGSQIIMDLPGGGNDYDENENTTGCGIPAEGRSIATSKTARIQEWPWLAALYRQKEMEQGIEQQFCGGALITDTHILTAAHCTRGLTPSEIRVRLGEYDFSKSNETRSLDYAVAEIIEHADFILATYANDIAIVRMTKPTAFNTYIWPICLPPKEGDYENETVVVAGWGQTHFAGPTSEVLLQVAIPVWNHKTCVDSFLQRITDDNVCAAGYEGGKDSCMGDSGGPLMYQLKNGRWVTIGIVSWGIQCGNKGSPGVYTKVSNYLPWIIQHTIAKY